MNVVQPHPKSSLAIGVSCSAYCHFRWPSRALSSPLSRPWLMSTIYMVSLNLDHPVAFLLILSSSAKYQPYDLLCQRFWRVYIKQYDTNDTGTISHLELMAMLDSLGSTLTKEMVDGFWIQWGKTLQVDDLSIKETIHCLEETLGRPESQQTVRLQPNHSILKTQLFRSFTCQWWGGLRDPAIRRPFVGYCGELTSVLV